MDKSKWFEAPRAYRLIRTGGGSGIFPENVNTDVLLWQPPEVGEPLRGELGSGAHFVTSKVTEFDQQGQTIEVTCGNDTYRLVAQN
jgi:hypothetical protein